MSRKVLQSRKTVIGYHEVLAVLLVGANFGRIVGRCGWFVILGGFRGRSPFGLGLAALESFAQRRAQPIGFPGFLHWFCHQPKTSRPTAAFKSLAADAAPACAPPALVARIDAIRPGLSTLHVPALP
jgi:hypothetical protein